MTRTSLGFTLIECLASMAIAAVLCCLSFPALEGALARARDASVKAAMVETLQRATTHAISTNTRVVLCPSADGASCLSGTTDWAPGWIAFADPDKDRERTGVQDTLLQAQPALPGSTRLSSTAGRSRIVVQPSGGTEGSNVSFTICKQGSSQHATAMILSNTGRWRFDAPGPEDAAHCAHGT